MAPGCPCCLSLLLWLPDPSNHGGPGQRLRGGSSQMPTQLWGEQLCCCWAQPRRQISFCSPVRPPEAPVCTRPAQQEAGRSQGQLLLVTLYLTRSMLGDQKLEQRSWRRYEALPCHLCLTTTWLCDLHGLLAQRYVCGGHGLLPWPGRAVTSLRFPVTSVCPHPPRTMS